MNLKKMINWFKKEVKANENIEEFSRLTIPKLDEPEVILRRAEKAGYLLKDPILREAFEALELAIVNKWSNASVHDKDILFELRMMLQASKDVRRVLEGYFREGKIELLKARHNEDKRKLND